MNSLNCAASRLILAISLSLLPVQLAAEKANETANKESTPPQIYLEEPVALQKGDETPWLYRGSDVPQDKEWLFGEMDNGIRYAVRDNGVPPGQVSIRIRIDAGSLHEADEEQGFAHLMEHMSFRESTYLKPGEAISKWQKLGATFGSDTNAETTPTHTVYKLDLPAATPQSLDESFKLLSGMMRAPVLNKANLAQDVAIVLAEKRENGGAQQRVGEVWRKTLFAGQRLAQRPTIGTDKTLTAATPAMIQAFHDRWYRPENVVIVVSGDGPPDIFAGMIEKYFSDWKGKGELTPAPDFGDPKAPVGADPLNPVGEAAVIVESDLPRTFTYAIMRPWRPVLDTMAYNEGLLIDALAQAIINRRLETKARTGGSFLMAQTEQDDMNRSTDATFVTFAPAGPDWKKALADVRSVIADAVERAPSQEEIDRESAEIEMIFASEYEQRSVQAGSKLADNIVSAVDIREAVAAPETVLNLFRSMKPKLTPDALLAHSKALFAGTVIRSVYVTPAAAEADEAALKAALSTKAVADTAARTAEKALSFDKLAPIGKPGKIASRRMLGAKLIDPAIEVITFDNGVRAILWPNADEPGRVTAKVRFGAGRRAFKDGDAAYIALGEQALIQTGLGELGQDEIDRIAAGRKLGFEFDVDDGTFSFSAQTRAQDLSDQLYLFAAKLAQPRWDAAPIERAKQVERVTFESQAAGPDNVIARDLEYVLSGNEGRYKAPDLAQIDAATAEGFQKVWAPILKQGDVEILIFGDYDLKVALESLSKTMGAMPKREAIPADVLARVPGFPADRSKPVVLRHRGDANQAAAVVAWNTGGGYDNIKESRQLEILTSIFSNRLLDAMREKSGASYAPQVVSRWPNDVAGGGRLIAIAQMKPEDVTSFFATAQKIAADLVSNPVSADEIKRAAEPLSQAIQRSATGNMFWLYQLEGASNDQRRVDAVPNLLSDYSVTTPAAMQALAKKYLGVSGLRIAAVPAAFDLPQAK